MGITKGWISIPPPEWGIIHTLRWFILQERKRSGAMGKMVVVVAVVVVVVVVVVVDVELISK